MKKYFVLTLLLFTVIVNMNGQNYAAAERTGLYFPLLKNKNIAVVANVASTVFGSNIVDTLFKSGLQIKKVFSPEHGFRNYAEAGETMLNSTDSFTGLPVISLYGKKMKPEADDLKDVDVVVFDLQDVGVRFFTYISTLTYVMEACAANHVQLIVLDRANPNIFYVDGPVLDTAYHSFVGLHAVPVVYGMTIGEYAMMVNGERWLKDGMICDLKVILLENYTHQTRMKQITDAPSPNLRNLNAVYLYPSLCFFEGTSLSVGRGTDFPFEVFGHPALRGFSFSFTPLPKKGGALNPKLNGNTCLGLDLRQYYNAHPKLLGRINLQWLFMAYRDMGSKPEFFNDYFDKLSGNSLLRTQIIGNKSEMEIRNSWKPGLDAFRLIRSKYLLYPEF